MTPVVVGFIVVERTRDAKRREHFRRVGRRYHSRDAARELVDLLSANAAPGVEYYLREDVGVDDLPQNL